ncbi:MULTISPECIES: FadR/GntR family transcriptional regulator [Pontibacillus]|uniref:FadR/GntR family transcriptional regulator n=1 Tax=Pontibacillus chungwhensis TaxID=265426 RepID=A0ABY8UXD6_9BACI|nr:MULTISPECIES: FadR/GntR family transcriptional regulator [Pontibacillus]MCD5325686.1 FadR family transcriptional regulator [Pontibacillus sp. HN14]WIF98073.1 FadR/GntR family transcriptional regulator [Pontibacillus chungwhensis]
MEYKQIRARKIYEEVADSLIDMLRQGDLKPGDRLDSVESLAKSFQVGRSAIREALSALRAMGLLEMRQGEGTFVKQFEPSRFSVPVSVAFLMKKEDIKELLEVRKILEVGAAESAAIHHTEEDLEAMEKALVAMGEAKGNGELGEEADLEFHLAVAHSTHNHMLINLMNSVSEIMVETMRETRRLWLHSEQKTTTLLQEHYDILRAIQHRDGQLAKKHMFEHLTKVEQALSNFINK